MRIGIDARFFGGEQSKGLGRYTQKLIEHLHQIDTDHEYVFFVQEETKRNWPYSTKRSTLVEAPYQWYSIAEQIFMPLKIKQQNIDLMHFPHFNVPLFYRGPFVVTIHDLIISRYPTSRATTLGSTAYAIKQFAYNRVIAHAAKHARRIITVSNYSKQDIQEYFSLPDSHIDVTYEAVDAFPQKSKEAYSSEADQQKVLHRYGIQKPYLLYVGNAYPHKNLEILLEVMAKLKKRNELDFQLVFVGKEDYFYLHLQQEAWAHDVDDVVVFSGFIPDRHLSAVYKGAFAYIFPSQLEGFGLPPLEAMLYGTPVISSQSSCLPEILGDAALYFENTDVNGIIKQIQRLRNDPKIHSELVQRGYAQVEKYDWRSMAESTLKIYETVLTESKTKITS